MGLSFTHIIDREGPAVYLLGNSFTESHLQDLGKAVSQALNDQIQVVYLDVNGEDGAQVSEFYEVGSEQVPAVLIIMDDDTLYQSWFGQDLPDAQLVANELRTVTGS